MNARQIKKLNKRDNYFRYETFYERNRFNYYEKKYIELHGPIESNDIVYITTNGKKGKKQRIINFRVFKNCIIAGCGYSNDSLKEFTINFSTNMYESDTVEKVANDLKEKINSMKEGEKS